MPLGNGDIGLNVWVEKSGDLLFYIGKTDAWGDDVKGDRGLLKVGRVRVKLTPALATTDNFRQTLVLREGAIEIQGGPTTLRVWVDANKPVIRVEAVRQGAASPCKPLSRRSVRRPSGAIRSSTDRRTAWCGSIATATGRSRSFAT